MQLCPKIRYYFQCKKLLGLANSVETINPARTTPIRCNVFHMLAPLVLHNYSCAN